jgi:hypothetical protein
MRHTLFSNRLESMFNQLSGYNSSTNMRILQKDIKHIDNELEFEYDKIAQPGKPNRRSSSLHVKKGSKAKFDRQISRVDAMAESIIEKLKNRQNTDRSGIRSFTSTFYTSTKKKPQTSTIDSKNTTLKSFMLGSKTTLQDTIYTDKVQNTEEMTRSPRSPRGTHREGTGGTGGTNNMKENINMLLKQKINNFTRDFDLKPLKFANFKNETPGKVVEFKSNSAKNEYLIRDYTMGQYSTENSKKNMGITETFYEKVKKKKKLKMKKEMRNFYKNKYGCEHGVISDHSLSSIKDSDHEMENDYEKYNSKVKKYFKVIFRLTFRKKQKKGLKI